MSDASTAIITTLLDTVDQVGANLVSDSYHHLAQYLAPMLYLLASIYIGILFLSAMRGMATYHDMLFSTLKLVAILTGALNYNYFCLFLYDLVTKEPLYIFKAIAIHGQHIDLTNINQALDDYLNKGLSFSNTVFLMGGWSNPTYLLFGCFLFLITLAATAFSVGLIVLAKMASVALLALSPLFIGFAMFELTKDIFSAFLKNLFTYALIPILTCIILMMTFNVMEVLLKLPDKVTFNSVWPFLLITAIQIYLLMHVYAKASSLASGFRLGSFMQTMQQAGQHAKSVGHAALGGSLGKGMLGKGGTMAGNAMYSGAKAAKNQLSQRLERFKNRNKHKDPYHHY